jgi:zinc protease
MKLFRITAYAFSAFLLITASLVAEKEHAALPGNRALPHGMEFVTSVEGITEYRLQNGLHVLLFPDLTKQTTTVNITYLVGSLHENYGESGMAHLLEHLMFRGTPKHPNLREEFTQKGARRNGSTWLDRTNYFETFPTSDANLQWAMELESDRMIHSFISKKDLDSEMTVVRNEFESGENDPSGILVERVVATAYLWHNYGKSTIGARSDIENVPIERLQAFYHEHYQPDNAVLLIAGNFDEKKALNLVNRYFSPLPRPKRVLLKLYTIEPTQDGERTVTLRRVGDVQVVGAAYHVPAGSHPDFPAIDVLGYILGDTPSGRLHKALVETNKASSVYNFSFQLREPGLEVFGAEVRQGSSLEEARDILIKTVEDFATKPPTAEEVERAKRAFLKDIDLALTSPENLGVNLSEWIAMGDWRLFFLNRDLTRKVTAEDVQRVAASYLKQSNRTVGAFIPTPKPDRAEIPPVPNIAEMLKDYKGDTVVQAGEAFDPSPSNIESRVVRSSPRDGVDLALLPKKTRGGKVIARLVLHFGDEKSLMNRSTAGELAGSMLMRGTSKHTRQQLQDEFDKLKADVGVDGSATRASASIETVKDSLPDTLKLVAEILREPSFPDSEFQQLKQQQLAAIEQQRSEPSDIGNTAFYRHMEPYPKGDVRYVETPEEAIASVKSTSLEDLKNFHKNFYGASKMEIAIVGDFDQQQISGLIGELFGDWKSPKLFERVADLYHDVPPVNESFETPDKANAYFIAGMNLKIRDDNPDYPALVLGNYILGAANNARLKVRIREKEGISYGVGSQLTASALDESGGFTAFAIYAPENVKRLEAAFKEELERALRDGFNEQEMATAKTGFLQSRQVSRAQDPELTSRLASYLFLKRTLNWDAGFEKKISALTSAQVLQALQHYLDPAKITIVKAGDFKKSQAAKQ